MTTEASPLVESRGPGRLDVLLRRLDEAVRLVEWRRLRRIVQSARLPVVYSGAVFAAAWLLAPLFLQAAFGPGGASGGSFWRTAAGSLLAASAAAAALAGYLRSNQFWHRERQLHTFQAWLLTHQSPARVAVTSALMGGVSGLALTAAPAIAGLLLGLAAGFAWWQLLLLLLLLPLCALGGSAVGAAVFFAGYALAPRRVSVPGAVLAGLLVAGLWLRIETVERGWIRPWEERPQRIARAIFAATPVSAVFGVAAPQWWEQEVRPGLGGGIAAWQAGVAQAGLLLLVSIWGAGVTVAGYRRLATEPEHFEGLARERLPSGPDGPGREYYWRGFRNPVLTRDIRTRLRSRDTAEFIFFASLAVAAGAFVPLGLTVRDLSDPLQTAVAARQVFFWLTMTLLALVTLIGPALTSDAITQERANGTLEMLIGTTLRPRTILLGKLLGAVSVMTLLISPSLPLFGLCYLFHGASEWQVAGVYLLVLVTVFVTCLIGVTQSAIQRKGGAARIFAFGSTLLFVAFPGGPFWIAAAATAPDAATRQQLMAQGVITTALAVMWVFFLVLFWGNACEQLEYSEY